MFGTKSFDKKSRPEQVASELPQDQVRPESSRIAVESSAHHQVVAERRPHPSRNQPFFRTFDIDGQIYVQAPLQRAFLTRRDDDLRQSVPADRRLRSAGGPRR